MTYFERWSEKVKQLEQNVLAAEAGLDLCCKERDDFLRQTVGFIPGSVVTLIGTAEMISKIIDMKNDKV